MSEYISDEEQMNRFKEWWNEYGISLLILVGLAITSIVGWNFYSDNRQQNIEASTALYAEYVDAAAEAKAVAAKAAEVKWVGLKVETTVGFLGATIGRERGCAISSARRLYSSQQNSQSPFHTLHSSVASLVV